MNQPNEFPQPTINTFRGIGKTMINAQYAIWRYRKWYYGRLHFIDKKQHLTKKIKGN